MFKTERVPVTLFQSTDEGAPQLTATAGSLKTVLKACLVTGYGSRRPLDWESAFEEDDYICFRSKNETSSRCWLEVGAQKQGGVATRGFAEMSGKGAGNGMFCDLRLGIFVHNTNYSPRWALVGHDRAFLLLVSLSDDSYGTSYMFFGDFPSLRNTGAECVFVKRGIYSDSSAFLNSQKEGLVLQRSASYPGRDVAAVAKSYDGLVSGRAVGFASAADIGYLGQYPTPTTGGFTAHEIGILEYVATATGGGYAMCYIGRLPGIYKTAEDVRGITDLTILNNLDDTGDLFLKFSGHGSGGSNGFLVNATAWEI